MRALMDGAEEFHGGRLIARRLRAHGISKLFTLSGGHLFSIYDGCRAEGIAIVDVRHEQTAAFAAEGWAKVTRELGVCALTAGPGVTNGLSALGSAQQNNSPLLVLGGRAPAWRWGRGSLQEIDHVPFVRPLVKFAATADSAGEIQELVDEAIDVALTPHPGPVFLDFPLDHVFSLAPDSEADAQPARLAPARAGYVDARAIEHAAKLLRAAERPVIMAGSGLYWGRGEAALRALAEALETPVFVNGLGRGCFPADHELYFSRARGAALKGADVALVIGVPLDFRLGFGGVFGEETALIFLDAAEPQRDPPRALAAEVYGALPEALDALRLAAAEPAGIGAGKRARADWQRSLRTIEAEQRESERESLTDPRAPLHPARVYAELASLLDRDAIIVGDGGDFVSFAGRLVDSFEPGCWLDPGPFGCLGSGPGYALAAKLAHPGRQVVLLLGDGAFGFAGLELDTLARHGVAVVGIVGNNGIWALEKYPMEFLYGYSVAAELRPGTRYDQVAEALGCHGELVRSPGELRPALERAFAAGGPALVNVLT
ncbi:MAG: acetolactate synthase, partial [Acidobacteriota bacterium]|nr:acetolactate synthase [Acidobacteriota bacterium]